MLLIKVITCAIFAIITHELGHFVRAHFLRLNPRVRLWTPAIFYDAPTPEQHRLVSSAGFTWELMAGSFLAWLAPREIAAIYITIAAAHFGAYAFYNKDSESNDFNGMGSEG